MPEEQLVGQFLASIQLIGGPVPVVIGVLAVLAAAWLAIRRTPRGRRARWALVVGIALIGGAAVGLAGCWIVSDLMGTFGISLSPTTRFWVAIGFAGLALAGTNFWRTRARRKIGAVAAALVFALLGAIGVNADFGQYNTVGSLVGVDSTPALPAALLGRTAAPAALSGLPLGQTWVAPADLPKAGIVGSVDIPGTVSGFQARQAIVYLPPSALVANPPALPVLIMLSGQPGSPSDVFAAGHLASIMDAFAATRGGLAPIVVVPDQLSARTLNPMCVDSKMGNSATYLTVDVPAWIRANLATQPSGAAWGIGGFSQGGTCAIQLGAGHPELFGSILDIAGELVPKNGSVQATIASGFNGDSTAYQAAHPQALLTKNAPYLNTVGIFAVGALDPVFTPMIQTMAKAARTAGMKTTLFTSPGTAHDWTTVRYAFEKGLPLLYAQMGLGAAP